MLLKIFLTFWLAVALLAGAQEIVSVMAQNEEQRVISQVRSLVDDGRTVVDAYETGGVDAARVAAADYRRRHQLSADLLDSSRRSILGQQERPAAVTLAGLANQYAEAHLERAAFNVGEGLAARAYPLPSGERVTLVVGLPRRAELTAARRFTLSDPLRLLTILAVGGVLCFALARHLSRPLIRVAGAANALAEGRLETRVGRTVSNRRDEVGQLARDFDRMAERIEALVAGQRRMLGDASHELRSPLARLAVAAGLARREAPPQSVEYFDRIDAETARLNRLVEQLLTLARIESSVDDELRGPVDVADVVQEIVADGDFEARSSCKRVVAGAMDPATLVGRGDLLRSAVENIVRNAVRYTAPGTTVDVALQRDPARRVVVLTVRDQGPGIPAASLPNLFKRFWRAPGAEAGGSGLGLAIAESVVRMHGGRIAATNTETGGLAVTIELPLSPP